MGLLILQDLRPKSVVNRIDRNFLCLNGNKIWELWREKSKQIQELVLFLLKLKLKIEKNVCETQKFTEKLSETKHFQQE